MKKQRHIRVAKSYLKGEEKMAAIQKRKQYVSYLVFIIAMLITVPANTQTTIIKNEVKTNLVHLEKNHPKMIYGTITNNTGSPLQRANILIKGTTNGTQTSIDGHYSIKAHLGDTLVFSYLGYKHVERYINSSFSNGDVVLFESETILPTIWVSETKEEKKEEIMSCSGVSIRPFSNVSFKKDLALDQERQLRAFATAQSKAFQNRKRAEKKAERKQQREARRQENNNK